MDGGFRSLLKDIVDANYSVEDVDHNESAVMVYLRGYYKKALDRLPPSLIPRALEAGFSFGFLDPVSNIITNTAAYEYSPAKEVSAYEYSPWPTEEEVEEHERKRSQVGTKRKRSQTKRKRSQVGTKKGVNTDKIAARSLQGLVAFLTSYFRYLTTREALRYLCLAKAELLIAVHLIEKDRDTNAFTIHLLTTKVALTCAALSAMSSSDFPGSAPPPHHPKVIEFVHSSLTLASRLDKVFSLLPMQGCLGTNTLECLAKVCGQGMHGTADPRQPMWHATSKLPGVARLAFPPHPKNVPVPIDLELAMSEVLLDKIRGFYLEAISSFPAPCLRSRHHRGLLKAGHCYGPFDPVSNIILNTIWYDTMFPPNYEFEVDMICDESLASTECRSLHGLVALIEKLFPALSPYDATRYLLIENARLDRVILRATKEGYHAAIALQDAYKAAARVAHHPNPTALANLATVLLPAEEGKLKPLLKAGSILSSYDIQTISSTLSQNDAPNKSSVRVQELTSRANMIVSAKRKEFEAFQSLVCNRVQAALKKHAHDKGVEYELLAICGVNAQIPKGGNFGDFANCDGYPYSHVNIWARQKGSLCADAAPTLLFIQCSNESEYKEDMPLCLPVSASSKDAGRCFHCECEGAKIVHPSSMTYLGQDSDFKDMARGEHPVTNEELIGFWGQKTVFLDTSEDYCIYFDPAWDADFAMRLNKDAEREEEFGDEFTPDEVNKISEILELMVASVG